MTDDQQIYELEVASKVELVAMVNRWKSAYDQLYVHHQQTSEQHEARLRMLSFELIVGFPIIRPVSFRVNT